MTLSDELHNFLKSNGAALVGFADLQEIDADIRDGFSFGISFAVALNPQIISEIHEGPTKVYVDECIRVDGLLELLGQAAVQFLKQRGYEAHTRTTPGAEYPDTLTTRLPQKTIATRAGLGWIGKCALLITQEFGPAIRLGSILTDAVVDYVLPIDTSQCGECTECVDACPAKAITGEDWNVGIRRNVLVDVFTCRKIARELLNKRTGSEITGRTFCGICIAACPLTQKYISGKR